MKSSVSVSQILQGASFFGFPNEHISGVLRCIRLARNPTRAVYLVLHAPTKKIKGMILTTGSSVIPCSAELLTQVLAHESETKK